MKPTRPAVAIRSSEPTVAAVVNFEADFPGAAVVRLQTGATWSRARALCTEGRVTVSDQKCVDPAARVPEGAVVVVDRHATKLATGRLAQSAIVFVDRDIVVVDKPVGMLSIAYNQGDTDTLVDCARILPATTLVEGSRRYVRCSTRMP